MKVVQKETSYYVLVSHEALDCKHMSVLEVYLIYSLPFMDSLKFVTRKYSYTIYKKDGFCIPASWDFHPFPINYTNFPYLWYALFESMSNFLLRSLVKHRYLALTHLQPCDTHFSMPYISSYERNALLFSFSNCILLFP